MQQECPHTIETQVGNRADSMTTRFGVRGSNILQNGINASFHPYDILVLFCVHSSVAT